MIAYSSLSPLVRNLFQLWSLLLCFAGMVCIVYSVCQKQHTHIILSGIGLLASYFLRQIVVEISTYYSSGSASPFCLGIGRLPWLGYAATFALLTLIFAGLYILIVRHAKNNITPSAIRYCADFIPCGICYWRENGRVIFVNYCMTELCRCITGKALLNGNDFYASLEDSIMAVDGNVWSFSHRAFNFQGQPLHELIAADVTELYAKTKLLQDDNAKLDGLKKELTEYNLSIDDTVRQQEILQAKIDIHDEMNRLLLSTAAADISDIDQLGKIFSQWQKNALLLCREVSHSRTDLSVSELAHISDVLGLKLIWLTPLPEGITQNQKELFITSAQEAMVNAVKHANAKIMEIFFESNAENLKWSFSNDGLLPEKEVRFTGGLENLRRLAAEQGAVIEVNSEKRFSLSIICKTF